jgi:hypothetical protein
MGPKLYGFEPNELSRVGSYAGEIPQSVTKAKNDHRIERRIGVDMGRFASETHQPGHKTFYQKTQNMCGYWWRTH